jgi:hypothetical protein
VVASAGPRAPGGSVQQRVDFVVVEEGDDPAVGPFERDCEHAGDVLGVFGVAVLGVAEQGVDRREPQVAGADAVGAFGFEVVEEGGDQWRVELGDVELGWLAPEPSLGVVEQQPERVAVGADRVRADVALGDQPVGEPCLQRRRERTHGRSPSFLERRLAASSSSSGAAVRYQ